MTKKYYPTGNEFIALPTIGENGAIEQINYLSMEDRGVIELTGDPFLMPEITVDQTVVPMDTLSWSWDTYWIPTFTTEYNGIHIRGTYIAPQDTKGWFLRVELDMPEQMDNPPSVTIALNGHFGPVLHSINETKPVTGERVVYNSLWNQGLVFDFRTGVTKFSYGFLTEGGFDKQEYAPDTGQFTLQKHMKWNSSEQPHICCDLFMGLGLEEVGAVTQAIHMHRETGDHLLGQLRKWLKDRVQTVGHVHLDKLVNVNQFFNYFYATGRTMDTEELILCTSRSPRYYVSAAYWDRDSLIWSFPTLLMTEPETAREALEYVFTRQLKNIGVHSRYIDGTVLEPGFELDELCAPLLALDQYLKATDDHDLLDESYMKKGLDFIYKRLMSWRHDTIDLFGTFLMPTDDMRVYPYLTYNNVLVWKSLQIYGDLFARRDQRERAEAAITLAAAVKEAIYDHLLIEVDGKQLFAWSGDLSGQHDFYDEPPGSLSLLAYYGFVNDDDPVFRNTMNHLYSTAFPHYFAGTNFEELGCSHADHPWVLAICNSLLNGRHKEAVDMLLRTEMDNYIACESIDEQTGTWVTGAHFATCAGFLVHALITAKKEGHI